MNTTYYIYHRLRLVVTGSNYFLRLLWETMHLGSHCNIVKNISNMASLQKYLLMTSLLQQRFLAFYWQSQIAKFSFHLYLFIHFHRSGLKVLQAWVDADTLLISNTVTKGNIGKKVYILAGEDADSIVPLAEHYMKMPRRYASIQ